mgnify:CR=1 FL=1
MKANESGQFYVNPNRSLITFFHDTKEISRLGYQTYNLQTGEKLTVGTIKKGSFLDGLVKANTLDYLSLKPNTPLSVLLQERLF